MKKIWQTTIGLGLGLAAFGAGDSDLKGYAREWQGTGLDAASAVIKDTDGMVQSHTADLYTNQEFTVEYTWTLPEYVPILNRDTMKFQIPSNVKVARDEKFEMVGTKGPKKTIGTGEITVGSQTGIVTFNNRFLTQYLNREGYIKLWVTGATPAPDPEPDNEETPTKPDTDESTETPTKPDTDNNDDEDEPSTGTTPNPTPDEEVPADDEDETQPETPTTPDNPDTDGSTEVPTEPDTDDNDDEDEPSTDATPDEEVPTDDEDETQPETPDTGGDGSTPTKPDTDGNGSTPTEPDTDGNGSTPTEPDTDGNGSTPTKPDTGGSGSTPTNPGTNGNGGTTNPGTNGNGNGDTPGKPNTGSDNDAPNPGNNPPTSNPQPTNGGMPSGSQNDGATGTSSFHLTPLTFITSQTAADQPAPTTDHISFPTPVVASQGSSADKALPQTGDRQNKQLSLVGLGLLLGLSVGGWWLRRRRQS